MFRKKDSGERDAKTTDFQTTRAERLVYPLYGMGQNMLLNFVTGFMMLFYTDVLVIPPYIISVFLVLSRGWDAVNDPLFGYVIDRAKFKSGNKFTPWLKTSSIMIPVTTLLLFLVPPSFPLAAKVALIVITYLIWDASYTISDVPTLSLLTAITNNANERTTILGYNGIFGLPAAIIVNVLLVPRLEEWGFPTVAAIICAIALSSMLWLPRIAKERNRENVKASPEIGLKELFGYLKGNKYLLNFLILSLTYGSLSIPFMNYILIQVYGGLGPIAVITLISLPLMLAIYIFVPKLIKRVEKVWVFRMCFLCIIFFGLCSFLFARESIVIYGVFYIIRSLFLLSAVLMLITFAADYVEYGHYKTGERREAITFSLQTFSTKFMGAISGAIGAFILGLINYDGELEVQAAETIDLIWTTGHLIPALGLILAIPFVWRCNLWSKDAQTIADINSGKISREEGEALLSREY